ncbi:MAG: hypothetical protein M0Z59_00095 [Nitrospiraceae bacterium]|nr:hypothetical protein [Nitrospiraceae bacterium]
MDILRRFLIVLTVFLNFFLLVSQMARAETFETNLSSQFIFGKDDLDKDESILAQYMRFNYKPDGEAFTITGYGRLWKNFGPTGVRDNGLLGRLYYLYLDYAPIEEVSLRVGRQWVNFTSGSTIMDGISANVGGIANVPVGLTVSAGRTVVFSLDAEYSRFGNYFFGADLHLVNLPKTQLGISFVNFFDEWDRAREEFGLNFRQYISFVAPYGEVRYDNLSKAIDEATLGLDIYPTTDLYVKAQYYYTFPTFDSTSIYSVFAVDKYQEYSLRAEYSLKLAMPVTVFAGYIRETYEDSDNANVFLAGARARPMDNLSVNAQVSDREGFGGHLLGFEISGDYRVNKNLTTQAGIQLDGYERPFIDETSFDNATRVWIGANYELKKDLSISARLEENFSQAFSYRTLGRVLLNWRL